MNQITTLWRLLLLGVLGFNSAVGYAQTLANPVALAFGQIEYSPPLTGSISVGTNGTVGYMGTFQGNGVGTAGQLEMQDTVGTVLEISCANGTLAHGSGATVALAAEVVVGPSSVGSWGAGTACAGLPTVLFTHTVNATITENILFFGGRLTPTSLQGGAYSTALSGGAPIQVRVVVQ